MMRPLRAACLLCCALALLPGTQAAASPDLPTLDIPRLERIAVDGGDADWADGGLRVELLTTNQPARGPLADFDGQVRLAWDERGLLLLAEVDDDYLTESPHVAQLWNGDGLEVFLSPERGSPEVMQYAVAPGVTGEQPRARWHLHDFRQDPALTGRAAEPRFAGRRTATGYVVEGLIPWSPLAIEPQSGRTAALQLFVNDYDEEGFERLLLYPGESSHVQFGNYREVRLTEDPGSPERVVSSARLLPGPGQGIGLTIEARDSGGDRRYELVAGGTRQSLSAADTNGSVLGFEIELEPEQIERYGSRMSLRAGGVDVGPVAIPPGYLVARQVLARAREVAAQVAAEPVAPQKVRAAALVLGWFDLLEQSVVDQGERDLREVEKRAGGVSACALLLEQALTDYEGRGDALAGRRGGFYSGYLSTADGSGQIYTLYVPPHYDPGRPWPLHVHMHGYGGTFGAPRNPLPAPDYLMAFVDGRGQTGYMGLGERDVLEVIADVRRHYTIDENRIYARGGSMGGRGTWSLTTRNPGLFAAALPDYGWADALFIGNLGNTPVWNFHDDTDWSVAIDHSRAAVSQLRRWGYPVIHSEATGGGHSMASFTLGDEREHWLAAQVRDPSPRRIRHSAWTPLRGRSYWLEILEFADPNRPAHVDARATEGNVLYLTSANAHLLQLDLAAGPFDRAAALTVAGAGDPVAVPAPLPERLYVRLNEAGEARVSAADPRPIQAYRPYIAGGLHYIWSSGEPFVIVRPTQGGDRVLLEHRARVCDFLSRETGSTYWEQMPIGQIPVLDDVAVTDRVMAQNNLVLVGPASANALLRRLMRDLPVRERGAELVVGDERLPFDGRLYNLFHYNPEAPQRYLAVISAAGVDSLEPRDFRDFVDREGPYGFHLKEVTPVRREVKWLRWDEAWRVQAEDGDGDSMPAALTPVAAWRTAFRQAACAATGSDYSLDWQEYEAGRYAWDPDLTRWGDLRANLDRPLDFYRGTLTGAELLGLGATVRDSLNWAGFAPPLDEGEIEATSTYRVCLPPNIAWALAGDLHYNLPRVEWARTNELWQHFRRMNRTR